MAIISSGVLPKGLFAAIRREKPAIRVSPELVGLVSLSPNAACERLVTRPEGLTTSEAAERLAEHDHQEHDRPGPGIPGQERNCGKHRQQHHQGVDHCVK